MNSSGFWGWHHSSSHVSAQLSYPPCSLEGTCLHLRKTCHHLPSPLHSHILHLHFGWVGKVWASLWVSHVSISHPAPGAGPDKAVVPMLCVSRRNFSQHNCAGSANNFYSSPICSSHFNPWVSTCNFTRCGFVSKGDQTANQLLQMLSHALYIKQLNWAINIALLWTSLHFLSYFNNNNGQTSV